MDESAKLAHKSDSVTSPMNLADSKGGDLKDGDDDGWLTEIECSKTDCKSESKGMNVLIDMAAVEKAERQPPNYHDKLERELEEQCRVIFELPDGSEGEQYFKMGHTVQVLKSFVEDEFEIPMTAQRLYLNEQIMLDPLTLSDFPRIRPATTVFVRVDGELPASASKK